MTMPESLGPESLGPDGLGPGAAVRQQQDKAYFLDLLGDSHNGLGHPDAAIEAYQQAAQGFKAQGASCSYALCLLKIAESHRVLEQPWHAAGYLEACHVGLAQARLLGEGRAGPRSPGPEPSRPAS